MKQNTLMWALLALLTVGCVGLGACSHHPTESEVAAPSSVKAAAPALSIETKQVAAEQKADFVTEITFRKKTQKLSAANKQMIHKTIADSIAQGQVKEVTVITWADSEYPSVNTKKLSASEQALARNRNKAIEKYISDQKFNVKVKTYSMAERANALKTFIGSSESRIKSSLEVAGIPTTDTTVKYPSKASKSIVMVTLE